LAALASFPVPLAAQHGEHGPAHRRPADLSDYLAHLDSAERDRDQQPAAVLDALELRPGMAIADLGSGSGYFTRRLAQAVGETGRIYAVDIEPEMLRYVEHSVKQLEHVAPVSFILARPDDPALPAQSVDLIFLCNTFHHLSERVAYFRKTAAALRPGGRIAIIDFYHDARSGDVGFPRRHLVSRETVITEMTEAGYRLKEEHAFLARQYFLVFVPSGP
jgi:ubiquinone/menaquinone biosynthesis C-methylase UbiE